MNSHSAQAHRWAKEAAELPENEMHARISDHIHTLLNEGNMEVAARTVSTFLLTYKLPISLRKLDAYDRFMGIMDNVIASGHQDNIMFVPYPEH